MGHSCLNSRKSVMRNFLNSWRRTFGIGALFTSLVFTGAWVKSYVDLGLNGKRANLLSVPGFIGVAGYNNSVEWPGHLPQINWYVSGFYFETSLVIAPEQVVKQIPSTTPQTIAMMPMFAVNRPPQSKLDFSPAENVHIMSAKPP
jgi:hypothetical protein